MARSTSSSAVVSGTSVNKVPTRSAILNLVISVRPGQWTKNLLVFAGLLFGRRLFSLPAVGSTGEPATIAGSIAFTAPGEAASRLTVWEVTPDSACEALKFLP